MLEVRKITPETEISHAEFDGHVQKLIDSLDNAGIKILPIDHNKILSELLDKIKVLDFRSLANLKNDRETVQRKHHLVLCIENLLRIAAENNFGLCRHHDFIYLFNGEFWKLFDVEELKAFLGEAAKKMGIDKIDAEYFHFKDDLYKQFLAMAHLPKPHRSNKEILINLKNGTFVINEKGTRLKEFDRRDFLTYQLPFLYDQNAKPPLFEKYLNKVVPDIDSQKILSEYLGYIFVRNQTLKLEKALLLYGNGANGKSVFFETTIALLGNENVSSFTLQSLTNDTGNHRAMLANKLLNYSSEINGKLETSIFKQLVSGEPVEAKLLYRDPFTMEDYARLIFNCNELPKEVEHTEAYFRRFLIIPFLIQIPEEEQDKELSKKIIQNELSGVFNWVLGGLSRLLIQKQFSKCEAAKLQLESYKRESDSVLMFLEEEGWVKSNEGRKPLKDVYAEYKSFCLVSGYRACSVRTFSDRLRNNGYEFSRLSIGMVVFMKKNVD